MFLSFSLSLYIYIYIYIYIYNFYSLVVRGGAGAPGWPAADDRAALRGAQHNTPIYEYMNIYMYIYIYMYTYVCVCIYTHCRYIIYLSLYISLSLYIYIYKTYVQWVSFEKEIPSRESQAGNISQTSCPKYPTHTSNQQLICIAISTPKTLALNTHFCLKLCLCV